METRSYKQLHRFFNDGPNQLINQTSQPEKKRPSCRAVLSALQLLLFDLQLVLVRKACGGIQDALASSGVYFLRVRIWDVPQMRTCESPDPLHHSGHKFRWCFHSVLLRMPMHF